jgi:hypothetical protein
VQVGSAYGFLCQAPLRLIILHPLKGQPKLWPLPKKLAATASMALKPPPHLVPFSWEAALQAKRERQLAAARLLHDSRLAATTATCYLMLACVHRA